MTDPDFSTEAVERFIAGPLTEIAWSKGMPVTDDDVESCKWAAIIFRALCAERDALKQSLEKAVLACGEQARARGEAEGRLAASEMAGVVDGWKARAEAAEAALKEAVTLCQEIASSGRCEFAKVRAFLASMEGRQ